MSDTITVIGNIAGELEHKQTPAGLTIASFRLASRHRRFDRESGGWIDGETNWYAVSAFRALGENALASLHKGQRVIVTGRLKIKEWESATRKGTSVEIEADAIGHDLLFGTSSFHKGGLRRADAREQGGSEADDAGGDAGADEGADESAHESAVAEEWAKEAAVPF